MELSVCCDIGGGGGAAKLWGGGGVSELRPDYQNSSVSPYSFGPRMEMYFLFCFCSHNYVYRFGNVCLSFFVKMSRGFGFD